MENQGYNTSKPLTCNTCGETVQNGKTGLHTHNMMIHHKNNPLWYKPTGVVDSKNPPVLLPHKPFTPTEEVSRVEMVATEIPSRCIGCRYRTPKKVGGEGLLCFQKNGECPAHIIQWAIRYCKNVYGEPIKSFASDEELLEALRL